jgi:hypothetical protein
MATTGHALPRTLRLSAVVWLAASVLLLIAAGSFLLSFRTQQQDRVGLIGMAALMVGLAALQVYLVLRLRHGKRSAREMLTTVAVIAGIPILVRGVPGLWLIATVMLLAVVPLWLPASNRYFQEREPKARKTRTREPRPPQQHGRS